MMGSDSLLVQQNQLVLNRRFIRFVISVGFVVLPHDSSNCLKKIRLAEFKERVEFVGPQQCCIDEMST